MEFRRRHRSDAHFREVEILTAVWDIDNLEPPGGFDPVKRVPFTTSSWDEASWPRSSYAPAKRIRKGQIAKIFLLSGDDIIDLCYVERPTFNSHTAKEYLCIELERRAWEKYGGPPGLQAAKKRKNERAARRVATLNHPPAALPPAINGKKSVGGTAAHKNIRRPNNRTQGHVQNNEPQIPAPAAVAPLIPPPERAVAGPSTPVRIAKRTNLQRLHKKVERQPENVDQNPALLDEGPVGRPLNPNRMSRMQQDEVIDVCPTLSVYEEHASFNRRNMRKASTKAKAPVELLDEVIEISD